jgi:hypothetical protein
LFVDIAVVVNIGVPELGIRSNSHVVIIMSAAKIQIEVGLVEAENTIVKDNVKSPIGVSDANGAVAKSLDEIILVRPQGDDRNRRMF